MLSQSHTYNIEVLKMWLNVKTLCSFKGPKISTHTEIHNSMSLQSQGI